MPPIAGVPTLTQTPAPANPGARNNAPPCRLEHRLPLMLEAIKCMPLRPTRPTICPFPRYSKYRIIKQWRPIG
jgi:hypothetical protein